MSVQARYSRLCPIKSSSRYRDNVETGMVFRVSAADFKSFKFCVGIRLVQYCEQLHFHDFENLSLYLSSFGYVIVNERNLGSRMRFANQ